MRIIHVARKPLSEGSVAQNVLKHGCGAINVEATRIKFASVADKKSSVPGTTPATMNGNEIPYHAMTRTTFTPGTGRWPANLILEHLPGCRSVGTREITNKGGAPQTMGMPARTVFGKMEKRTSFVHYFNPETGKETIPAWECEPGCPVAALDEQSGDRPVSGAARTGRPATAPDRGFIGPGGGLHGNGTLHNDSGGASRFFKQIGGK